MKPALFDPFSVVSIVVNHGNCSCNKAVALLAGGAYPRADGSRTNRSTKQTEREKAKEVADEMQKTINGAQAGIVTREKLFQTFNDLMVRIGEHGLSAPPKSAQRNRSRKAEMGILAELRRRLGR